jgi:superfamily I DNA/RNA helicase
LWFVTNPNSGLHLEKILNQKKTTFTSEDFEHMQTYAAEHDTTLGAMLSESEDLDFLKSAQRKRLDAAASFLNELSEAAQTEPVAELIVHICRYLKQTRTERIEQLRLSAVPFEQRLSDFLESTVLQKDTDTYNPQADRVTLMTLHASKGLEFPVVFVVGCEENLLPYQRDGEEFDLEEERRLFYVGMTRARQKLILTHAKTRFLFGQRQENEPSRFVNDIENTLKELKKMTRRKPKEKEEEASTQLKLF